MLLVDTKEGRIVDDRELKSKVASRYDFKSWVLANMISLQDLNEKLASRKIDINAKPIDVNVNVQSDQD